VQSNANGYCNRDGDGHVHAYANCYSHPDTYSNGDFDSQTNAYAEITANAKASSHAAA
jgi:hypothetical protein